MQDSPWQHSRTNKQDSRLGLLHAQLLPERLLWLLRRAEGRPYWQAMHRDLLWPQAHFQRPLPGELSRHKAAVNIRVEPGVMAGGQISDDSRKLHRLLQPLPAASVPLLL